MDLLNSHPEVVCDGEILKERRAAPEAFVRVKAGAAGRTGARAYGFKLLSYQLNTVVAPDRVSFLRRLHERHGYRIIYLKRENLLRHALSNIRARQLGFHRRAHAATRGGPTEVSPEALLGWLKSSADLAQRELEVLAGLERLTLVYEDNLDDPAVHERTVAQVCEYLGIPSAPVHTSLVKTSPDRLEDLVADPELVRRTLAGTEFERFLF